MTNGSFGVKIPQQLATGTIAPQGPAGSWRRTWPARSFCSLAPYAVQGAVWEHSHLEPPKIAKDDS